MSIEKILSEKKPLIDEVIEKYIPRKLDDRSMEFICGKTKYEYNIEACQKTIADPIWELLDRGGKRWRPTLFLLVAEALKGDMKKIRDFLIIPEVVHEGTLMIDDIEDSSELRRGKPCTHKIFGEDIAINAGNAMYYLPLLPFIKNKDKIDSETLAKAYNIYAQEMINISFGQGMDIAWHRGLADADNITEKEYMQMCAFKTGTLARMSAKLAAVLSNADNDITEKLGEFAESLGVAFQIRDDILDISAPENIGKEFGNDIKEGKRTLMVIHALQNANENDKKRLVEILNKHTDNIEERKEAIGIIKRYNSVEYAKGVAKKIVNESWNKIDEILPDSDAKRNLKAFANFVIEREF
ncbi:MAG: polyprenyl synthetase family protein [Candidatus Aenigmarchaeota archaeon]|nr:polyprenyl synthetase family protein [Candidatus Aenigmarchaeota archaeon]